MLVSTCPVVLVVVFLPVTNELIIRNMSLNKYVVLDDKAFYHFWEGNSDSTSQVRRCQI